MRAELRSELSIDVVLELSHFSLPQRVAETLRLIRNRENNNSGVGKVYDALAGFYGFPILEDRLAQAFLNESSDMDLARKSAQNAMYELNEFFDKNPGLNLEVLTIVKTRRKSSLKYYQIIDSRISDNKI